MLKEHFLILFLVPYIIPLRADEAPFELGLFQEIVYEYVAEGFGESRRADDSNPRSCREIIDSEYSEVTLFGSSLPCEGSLMDCERMQISTFCVEFAGQRKIRFAYGNRPNETAKTLGHSYDCSARHLSMYFPKNINFTHYHNHCHCRCFKDYFRIHLGAMRSWEDDNYVIVGVRFKLQDDVLHLQIGQGILEANGVISEFTWVPPRYNPSQYHSVDLNSNTFFLDDLTLNPGYVLTGVKFEFMEVEESEVIKGFGISISGVPFNYSTGKLDLKPEYRQIVKAHRLTRRKELKYKLVNPVDQIESSFNKPSSAEYNYYVRLQRSEIETDFGQTTLPLFDSRPVAISPFTPIAGIGICHNGTENHAGFIALRLYPVY